MQRLGGNAARELYKWRLFAAGRSNRVATGAKGHEIIQGQPELRIVLDFDDVVNFSGLSAAIVA